MNRTAVLLDDHGQPTEYFAKIAHVSGNQIDVLHCLAGDTRYLTREGTKTLEETVGTVQHVLTGSADPHGGQWVEAMIHEFGEQPLLSVTLQRNKQTKVVRATPEHRWLLTAGPKRDQLRRVTTAELQPGHRLPHLRLPRFLSEPDHDGVRMGFIFGDGSIKTRNDRTYGFVTLWGGKRDLAKYFDEIRTGVATERVTENGVEGLGYYSGMSGFHKNLPALTESREYLLGWLMGYFAADGTVSAQGQATLSSVVLESLLHVRDVCTLLGIGTYAPTSKMRRGFGGVMSMLHQLGFSAADLGDSFFLREDQRLAARSQHHERFGWSVKSIVDHGERDVVYCPRVPGTESFVLEDNVHTGQCPFCGSGAIVARSDGSISCSFCNAAFSVTVSPVYPAFPQSVGGDPYPWPGRPDGGTDPSQMSMDPDQPGGGFGGKLVPGGDDGDGDGEDGDDDGGNPFAADDDGDGEDDSGDDDGGTQAEVGGSKKPPFGKKKSAYAPPWVPGPNEMAQLSSSLGKTATYRTAFGGTVPRDDYLRHLAIATANDPAKVAAHIRAQRALAAQLEAERR